MPYPDWQTIVTKCKGRRRSLQPFGSYLLRAIELFLSNVRYALSQALRTVELLLISDKHEFLILASEVYLRWTLRE